MKAPESRLERLHELVPALLVAGIAWWACGSSVEPYLERARNDREVVTGLHQQIDDASTSSGEIPMLKSEAKAIGSQIDRLEQKLPGPLLAFSLPDQLKKHFAPFGLSMTAARMSTVEDDVGLPGYSRGYWSVGLTLADTNRKAAGALLAVAEVEEQIPFVKVLDFAILPDTEDPARQVASLKLMVLFRK